MQNRPDSEFRQTHARKNVFFLHVPPKHFSEANRERRRRKRRKFDDLPTAFGQKVRKYALKFH